MSAGGPGRRSRDRRHRPGAALIVGGLALLALLVGAPSEAAIVDPPPPAIPVSGSSAGDVAADAVDRAGAPAVADAADTPATPEAAEPPAPAASAAAPADPVPPSPSADRAAPGPSGDAEPASAGYRWRGPPAAVPDWRGAGRDAAYFVGYQLVGIAVIYTSPASMSGWSKEDKREFGFEQWQDHVRNPVAWDGDQFFINWVLHPYWGGAYYVRGRERGLSEWQSFGFSALMSTLWEYGAEAIAEPVSVQDLVFTPVLGALLGEFVFEPWREHIRAKPGELDGWDRTILALTDPLGAINATIDRWFGIKSTTSLQPFAGRTFPARLGQPGFADPALARRDNGRYWGLQLNVRW